MRGLALRAFFCLFVLILTTFYPILNIICMDDEEQRHDDSDVEMAAAEDEEQREAGDQPCPEDEMASDDEALDNEDHINVAGLAYEHVV